jgi:hypothetical protein
MKLTANPFCTVVTCLSLVQYCSCWKALHLVLSWRCLRFSCVTSLTFVGHMTQNQNPEKRSIIYRLAVFTAQKRWTSLPNSCWCAKPTILYLGNSLTTWFWIDSAMIMCILIFKKIVFRVCQDRAATGQCMQTIWNCNCVQQVGKAPSLHRGGCHVPK